jgi:hypothetical protein
MTLKQGKNYFPQNSTKVNRSIFIQLTRNKLKQNITARETSNMKAVKDFNKFKEVMLHQN